MNHQRRAGILVRASVSVLAVVMVGPMVSASVERRVSANLVFWDQTRGFDAIVTNADVLSEVSPFWYHLGGALSYVRSC